MENPVVVLKKIEDKLAEFFNNTSEFRAFIRSASYTYKYHFYEQVGIYIKNPKAVACGSFGLWNEFFNRRIHKGSGGIAIPVDYRNRVKQVKYVWDISQTYEIKESNKVNLFEYSDEYKQALEIVKKSYNIQTADLEESLRSITKKAVNFEIEEIIEDANFTYEVLDLSISETSIERADLIFEKYKNPASTFVESVVISMIYERMGLGEKVDQLLKDNDFSFLKELNEEQFVSLFLSSNKIVEEFIEDLRYYRSKEEKSFKYLSLEKEREEETFIADLIAERKRQEIIKRVYSKRFDIYELIIKNANRRLKLSDEKIREISLNLQNVINKRARFYNFTNDEALSLKMRLELTKLLLGYQYKDDEIKTLVESVFLVENALDKRADELLNPAVEKEKLDEKKEEKKVEEEPGETHLLTSNTLEQVDEEKESDVEVIVNPFLIENLTNQAFEKERELEEKKQESQEIDELDKISEEIKESQKPLIDYTNYKLSVNAMHYTPSQRLNHNVDAIMKVKLLEEGQLELDEIIQESLSKYVGWGGLSEVFDERNDKYAQIRTFLKENLSESQYDSARESVLTSFYTPNIICKMMYDKLLESGFSGGNILEPSCGTGRFIGLMPKEIENSNVYAVELDDISSKISKYLYPRANVLNMGFEKTHFSNNLFDVAISNVPFGDFKIYDKEYNDRFYIHDYFFIKSLDKLRAGGVLAFITSSGTMDKVDNTIRRYIGERADLLGAIRLPNNAFKSEANTKVTSDILFFQKRSELNKEYQDWYDLKIDENGYKYNTYFVERPQMIIGEMQEISSRFGPVLACVNEFEFESEETLEMLKSAFSSFDFEYQAQEAVFFDEQKIVYADANTRNYTFCMKNDEVYFRENSIMSKIDIEEKHLDRYKAYIRLGNITREYMNAQIEELPESEINELQSKLNDGYDKFYEEHGLINSRINKKFFKDDDNYPLLSSLEILDENNKLLRKSDFFYKKTISLQNENHEFKNAQDALIYTYSKIGKVDIDQIEELYHSENIIEELHGEIFRDLSKLQGINQDNAKDLLSLEVNYQIKDELLSGNIKEKIERLESVEFRLSALDEENFDSLQRKRLKEIKEDLSYQIERLKESMPPPLKSQDISLKLGSTWIDLNYYNQFIHELLEISPYSDVDIEYVERLSEYNITNKSDRFIKAKFSNIQEYGTGRMSALHIIENTLNQRAIVVRDKIDNNGKEEYVINEKETLLATQKQELIKEKFNSWIFEDYDRRTYLTKKYNEIFNSYKIREYDGSSLLLPDKNPNITLKSHQLNAIARGLYGGNTLLAHVVGAGKSFTMIAIAMESKRLNLCKKSLLVVPNHLTKQMGNEFLTLYPLANILVAEKSDFTKENRRKLFAKIATGNYDAIIIGHSQFEKLQMSKSWQEKYIKEEIANLEYSLSSLEERSFSAKKLEQIKKNFETRLEELFNNPNVDEFLSFEELGIDKIFIDEAHYYKNLYVQTKIQNVAGITSSNSMKANNLLMKTRYLNELTGGKGIVFATGTPISNSMAEIYTMQRYLQHDTLRKLGIENFDSWASFCAEVVTAFELTPEGNGYHQKSRFSKFYNIPELMNIFKEVADIKLSGNLNLKTPDANYHVIKTLPTYHQRIILEELLERASKVRGNQVDPRVDNMLKIVSDGRKLALDQRIIDNELFDEEYSKVNACVRSVFDLYEKGRANKLTQLIFCDMSVPKPNEFSVYTDIKEKLIKKGVAQEEIAFIHDAKTDLQKQAIFDKVKTGEIRVLIGSTDKMGAGTNVQDRLIAIHDLDVPWRPSDLGQRSGRIIRQGNLNREVHIFRYLTENTFDAYLWQIVETKQKFISQIMTDNVFREYQDLDSEAQMYAGMKASATNNPHISEKMSLEVEIAKLKTLEISHKTNKFELERKIKEVYPTQLGRLETGISNIKKDIENIFEIQRDEKGAKIFSGIEIKGKVFSERKDAAKELLMKVKEHRLNFKFFDNEDVYIGKYRGFKIYLGKVSFSSNKEKEVPFYLESHHRYHGNLGQDAYGNLTRLDNLIDNIKTTLLSFEDNLRSTKENFEKSLVKVKEPFLHEEELQSKKLRLLEVEKILNQTLNSENSIFADDFDEEKNKEILEIKFEELEKNITYDLLFKNFKLDLDCDYER